MSSHSHEIPLNLPWTNLDPLTDPLASDLLSDSLDFSLFATDRVDALGATPTLSISDLLLFGDGASEQWHLSPPDDGGSEPRYPSSVASIDTTQSDSSSQHDGSSGLAQTHVQLSLLPAPSSANISVSFSPVIIPLAGDASVVTIDPFQLSGDAVELTSFQLQSDGGSKPVASAAPAAEADGPATVQVVLANASQVVSEEGTGVSSGETALLSTAGSVSAIFMPFGDGRPYASNEVIVKLDAGADYAALAAAAGVVSVETLSASGIQLWHLSTTFEQAYEAVGTNAAFSVFQPNYEIGVGEVASSGPVSGEGGDQSAFATPNDPGYSSTYGMTRINAPAAWGVTIGSSSVVVAVLDTGVDWNHADLAANIWTNPGEIAGNGIDDEHDGYIDDVRGWDFANNDNNPFDDNGHGTHVAGTIGAVGNNGIGVAGVAWTVKIMPLKFLNASGSGSTTNAIKGIEYAESMGVKIINASWGSYGFSSALLNAISGADLLFVAAAGNDSNNNDGSFKNYPSSYTLDNIIAVAATTSSDSLASFSNYGATSVDLGAPGVSIYSTLPGNSYGFLSGTSMATPHVAGAAALLLATDPSLSVAELRSAILDHVHPVASLSGKVATGGILDAYQAVNSLEVTYGFAATGDFNSDGKSDILWRGEQGQVGVSLMDGLNASATGKPGSAPPSWHIMDAGDFNGDGKSDILWRNDDGQVGIWLMDGTAATTKDGAGLVPNSWNIVGTGDFNDDGKSDILWRNSDGQVGVWLMDGINPTVKDTTGLAPTSWVAENIADFNGDGKSDILWRNNDGQVGVWLMNGVNATAREGAGYASLDWHIAGTADLNGDGKDDIIWRNNDGQVGAWIMNGVTPVVKDSVGYAPVSWHIAGSGDFNNDTKDDLLWGSETGDMGIWLMNGLTVITADQTTGEPSSWKVHNTYTDLV